MGIRVAITISITCIRKALYSISRLSSIGRHHLTCGSFSFRIFMRNDNDDSNDFIVQRVTKGGGIHPAIVIMVGDGRSTSTIFIFRRVIFRRSNDRYYIFCVNVLVLHAHVFGGRERTNSTQAFSRRRSIRIIIVIMICGSDFQPKRYYRDNVITLGSFRLPILDLLVRYRHTKVSASYSRRICPSIIIRIAPGNVSQLWVIKRHAACYPGRLFRLRHKMFGNRRFTNGIYLIGELCARHMFAVQRIPFG